VKFAFVAAEKARGEFKVTELCRALRVSTSGFYASRKRAPSKRAKKDALLKVKIQASFDASRKTYGSPRVHEDLLEDGEKVGRNRVIRLLQEQGLRARVGIGGPCVTFPATADDAQRAAWIRRSKIHPSRRAKIHPPPTA